MIDSGGLISLFDEYSHHLFRYSYLIILLFLLYFVLWIPYVVLRKNCPPDFYGVTHWNDYFDKNGIEQTTKDLISFYLNHFKPVIFPSLNHGYAILICVLG